jgi:hypothetical protein
MEAMMTSLMIAIAIIKDDTSEQAEVDCKILYQWLNVITDKLRATGEYDNKQTII